MKGFDAEFPDLDTYIRVITARIWEGRRLEDIRRYYADPCIVETPTGVTTTAQQLLVAHHPPLLCGGHVRPRGPAPRKQRARRERVVSAAAGGAWPPPRAFRPLRKRPG